MWFARRRLSSHWLAPPALHDDCHVVRNVRRAHLVQVVHTVTLQIRAAHVHQDSHRGGVRARRRKSKQQQTAKQQRKKLVFHRMVRLFSCFLAKSHYFYSTAANSRCQPRFAQHKTLLTRVQERFAKAAPHSSAVLLACLFRYLRMQFPRFASSKPSKFAFTSDEKSIRQLTTSFVRCYLKYGDLFCRRRGVNLLQEAGNRQVLRAYMFALAAVDALRRIRMIRLNLGVSSLEGAVRAEQAAS